MDGRRRARAAEYAERLNRAAALLSDHSAAAVVRVLQGEHGLSERQARRYVRAAERAPEGVVVPERTAVFTVKLPVSVIASLRSVAAAQRRSLGGLTAEALRAWLERERGGGRAG